MRTAVVFAALSTLLSLPAVAQNDASAGVSTELEAPDADTAPDADPPPAPVDDDGDDDVPPADATYDRAEGEGYRRHDYGDDDGYATGRRRAPRRDAHEDEGDDAYDDDRADDPGGEGAADDRDGRRRGDRDGKQAAAGEPSAAPNPWVGPGVVGLCALGSSCACLTPLACMGLFPELSTAAAILAAPTLVISAVAGSAVGGLGHFLFADNVGALPCVVAPVAAFVLAAIFGGLGTVTGLIVGTSAQSDALGVVAALSVLIPGALATAAGAGAAYAGVALLTAPGEEEGASTEGGEAAGGEEAEPSPPPSTSFEAGPRGPRLAGAMVY